MTVLEIIESLQRARPEKESLYHFRAEHDRIYVGSLDWKMPKEDKERLEELGWCPDEEADGWTALV